MRGVSATSSVETPTTHCDRLTAASLLARRRAWPADSQTGRLNCSAVPYSSFVLGARLLLIKPVARDPGFEVLIEETVVLLTPGVIPNPELKRAEELQSLQVALPRNLKCARASAELLKSFLQGLLGNLPLSAVRSHHALGLDVLTRKSLEPPRERTTCLKVVNRVVPGCGQVALRVSANAFCVFFVSLLKMTVLTSFN